jgi:tetratricopeptide (TPR) repeat protein
MMPSQSQASVQRILTGGTARRVVLIAVTSAVIAATPSSASPARKSSHAKARVAHPAKNRAARRQAKTTGHVAPVAATPRVRSPFMAVSDGAPAGTGIADPNAPSLLQVPVQAAPAGELPAATAPAATEPTAPAPVGTAPTDTPPAVTPRTEAAPAVTPPAEVPAVVTPDVTIPAVTPPPATDPVPVAPVNPAPVITEPEPPATIIEQATALRGLGEIRRRQLRYSEATDFFKRATLLAPADLPSRLGLAQSLRGLRRFQEALVESEQALALEPNNLQARVLHAQLLDDNNRSAEAAKEIEAIVAALPAKPDTETYTALSQAFITQRNYPAALQLLERAKQDWPGDPFIARNYAEALTASRDWDKALAAWDALMVADPKDADALVGKARVYYYQGNYRAAADLLERGRQEWPQDTLITRNYAEVMTQLREWDKALAAWDALPADPKDAGILLGKARIYNYSSREELASRFTATCWKSSRPIIKRRSNSPTSWRGTATGPKRFGFIKRRWAQTRKTCRRASSWRVYCVIVAAMPKLRLN